MHAVGRSMRTAHWIRSSASRLTTRVESRDAVEERESRATVPDPVSRAFVQSALAVALSSSARWAEIVVTTASVRPGVQALGARTSARASAHAIRRRGRRRAGRGAGLMGRPPRRRGAGRCATRPIRP